MGIFNSSKVFAKEDNNPFDTNITEISPQNIGGGGSISIDDSSLIEDIEAHLIKKFNTSNWSLKKSESTERHECTEYVIDDDHTHQIVCECGASMRITHVILEENGVMICLFCRYIPEQ